MEAIAFSPAGDLLATGSANGEIHVFDTGAWREICSVIYRPNAVLAVAFSSDGKTLLAGGEDRSAIRYEVRTGLQIGPPMQHEDVVTDVAFHPDGKLIVTGGKDCKVRFWNAELFQGEPKEVERWANVITGSELGADDIIRPLSAERWRQLSQTQISTQANSRGGQK